MCDFDQTWPSPDEVVITCKNTGKPPTVTNKYGMFCEDLCGFEACVEASIKGENLIENLAKLLGK